MSELPAGAKALFSQGDVGVSSRTIVAVLTREDWILGAYGSGIPHDDDDFGRCVRMLRATPGWEDRIYELAAAPEWGPLVGIWTELTALHDAGNRSELNSRLHAANWRCDVCKSVANSLRIVEGIRRCIACWDEKFLVPCHGGCGKAQEMTDPRAVGSWICVRCHEKACGETHAGHACRVVFRAR